jgi:uncharacterized membrane protein YgdD (TMEM256/DUF423 family)
MIEGSPHIKRLPIIFVDGECRLLCQSIERDAQGPKQPRGVKMKFWLLLGAANGFLAVGFGAFAAHGLKSKVDPVNFAAFETAAQYHMYHALALVAVAWVASFAQSSLTTTAGWAFIAGIILFSGSLYFLGVTGSRALVLLTPIGGTAFLIGWLCLAVAAFQLD